MQSRLPYYLAVAIVTGLALSFAAGVESAAVYASANAEASHAQRLTADLVEMAPFDYFPSHYQIRAKEIEPLPPQF